MRVLELADPENSTAREQPGWQKYVKRGRNGPAVRFFLSEMAETVGTVHEMAVADHHCSGSLGGNLSYENSLSPYLEACARAC